MTSTDSQPGSVRTAVLALDYATYIVENFSHDPAVAQHAANALAAARSAGLPVIHVVHEAMVNQIHPLLAPTAGEPVLAKSTMGAFATTNLHQLLQDSGVSQVVVAGVATSGTVLSTARWAFDVGYQVTICSDACADPDPQAHAALLDKSVFPQSWIGLWRLARVLPAADIPELGSPSAGSSPSAGF